MISIGVPGSPLRPDCPVRPGWPTSPGSPFGPADLCVTQTYVENNCTDTQIHVRITHTH